MTLTQLQQDMIRRIDLALQELSNLAIEWGDIGLQESVFHLMADWEQSRAAQMAQVERSQLKVG